MRSVGYNHSMDVQATGAQRAQYIAAVLYAGVICILVYCCVLLRIIAYSCLLYALLVCYYR